MSDDGELVTRYLGTHRERDFATLYHRCAPALWRLALRLARGDEAAARDLSQETWLRATRRLESFRRDARLGPWLAGIAWNCWRETARRSIREAPAGSPPGEPVVDPPDHALSLDVRDTLDGLPEGYRAVLLLHDLEGYTHGEIGEALGVSVGTSKSQLARARAAFRERLGEDPTGVARAQRVAAPSPGEAS